MKDNLPRKYHTQEDTIASAGEVMELTKALNAKFKETFRSLADDTTEESEESMLMKQWML